MPSDRPTSAWPLPPPGPPPAPAAAPRPTHWRWIRPLVAFCLLPFYAFGMIVALLYLVSWPTTSTPLGVVVAASILGLPGVGLALLAFGGYSKWAAAIVASLVAIGALGFAVLLSSYLPPNTTRLAATLDTVTVPPGYTMIRESRADGSACFDACPEVTRSYCVTGGAPFDLGAWAGTLSAAGLPVAGSIAGDELFSSTGGGRKIYLKVRPRDHGDLPGCASGRFVDVSIEGRDG